MRSFPALGRAISLAAAVAMFGTVMGAPVQAATTYKIGVDLPMSGADASNGIPTDNGVVLAVEQANKKGLPGGIMLEHQVLDDAVQGVHDPAAGAKTSRRSLPTPACMAMSDRSTRTSRKPRFRSPTTRVSRRSRRRTPTTD